MKNIRFSHPLVLLGLGALGLGGLLAVKSLASIPRERKTNKANGGKTADAQQWVVLYSGHGSAFRYEGADPQSPPPPPYLTFEEAREQAVRWELHADTIGGRAQLKNVVTGEIVTNF